MKYGAISSLLIRLAARRDGTKTSDAELRAFTMVQIGNAASKLVAAGKLFSVKTAHSAMTLYADKADADRALAALAFRRQPMHTNPKATRMPARADGPVVFSPSFTGIQYGPSHAPRFQEMAVVASGGNQRGRVLVADVEAAKFARAAIARAAPARATTQGEPT